MTRQQPLANVNAPSSPAPAPRARDTKEEAK
jgi:hypothetical protein